MSDGRQEQSLRKSTGLLESQAMNVDTEKRRCGWWLNAELPFPQPQLLGDVRLVVNSLRLGLARDFSGGDLNTPRQPH